uniref:Uncharacterized protein n=1 Tax=Anser brachyrhynchus TaxID=132585 RepID=A0A8B9BUC8_9AVES
MLAPPGPCSPPFPALFHPDGERGRGGGGGQEGFGPLSGRRARGCGGSHPAPLRIPPGPAPSHLIATARNARGASPCLIVGLWLVAWPRFLPGSRAPKGRGVGAGGDVGAPRPALAVSPGLCGAFNIDVSSPRLFHGPPEAQFGYKVLQRAAGGDRWLLVGAPWDGPEGDRRGDVYKCRVGSPNATCAKANLGFPPRGTAALQRSPLPSRNM